MSNILFALYHDFSANSAVHVHNFANQLHALGHSTAVAIPDGEDNGATLGTQNYSVQRFDQVDGEWARVFPDGRAPEIVHAWTPRENVRLFCEKLAGFCDFSLFVHLEDNEELILEVNLGMPLEKLVRLRTETPANLSHPRNYRAFIASAAGVTMIMDRLERFVPNEVPKLILWPGADEQLFYPRPRDPALLREQFGLSEETVVLCYTGNVHSANARDVRSLYLAAAILDREGIPARLIRTGRDFCPFLGPDEEWARRVSIELGHIPYQEIPSMLSLADVLVQPGADNAFNEFRLPGKLPEFFAMGRPVIVPRTNVGRFVRHGEEAWVLEKVDALSIAGAALALRKDKALSERLAMGAVEFGRQHFNWKKNAGALMGFYQQIALERKEHPNGTTVTASQ